jgi:UDP-3-O-[3-hydroxymyristoyl] N-acetylglucosamine deacetylase
MFFFRKVRMSSQQTLYRPFQRSGVGLHSGDRVTLTVHPAPVNSGRVFQRVDLPGAPVVSATCDRVHQTTLSTELRQGEATVRTVEHLLAALAGMGVDNARIEIDGAEVPLLDGSAQDWVVAIAEATVMPQAAERGVETLDQPIWVRQGEAFVAALPAPNFQLTYGIDFADLPAIGEQWFSWNPEKVSFVEAIAPARTFGFAEQIEQLRQAGLIKGGSLENALVCSREGWLNPPLRFVNEPVRHKLLDLLGDLSLVGQLPIAHVIAYKASHQLHTQLAQRIVEAMMSV